MWNFLQLLSVFPFDVFTLLWFFNSFFALFSHNNTQEDPQKAENGFRKSRVILRRIPLNIRATSAKINYQSTSHCTLTV